MINVQAHGLMGDGTTDDSAAFKALINSLPTLGVSGTHALYFPAGNYLLDYGFLFSRSVSIYGDGPRATVITRTPGAIGDLITFNAIHCTLGDIEIESENATSGDDVVINASYCALDNVYLRGSRGTAIRVGKTTRSLGHRITRILQRGATAYGIWVTDGSNSGSTDGMWSDSDFGGNGLSGVRIDSSSLNLSNIHTWGNGLDKNDLDAFGFHITSSGHMIVNSQAETNWAHGWHLASNSLNGSIVTGSKSWANGLAGVSVSSYRRATLVGMSIYDNGLRNPEGAVMSDLYAAIRNDGSDLLTVTSTRSFDRGTARTVSALGMSRGAYVTQIYDYYELGNLTYNNVFTGNSFPSSGGIVLLGNGGYWEGNRTASSPVPVPSSATLQIRSFHKVIRVTGTTAIDDATVGVLGQSVTLVFATTGCTISGTSSIRLTGGPFTSTINKVLGLMWVGSFWIETFRS